MERPKLLRGGKRNGPVLAAQGACVYGAVFLCMEQSKGPVVQQGAAACWKERASQKKWHTLKPRGRRLFLFMLSVGSTGQSCVIVQHNDEESIHIGKNYNGHCQRPHVSRGLRLGFGTRTRASLLHYLVQRQFTRGAVRVEAS